MESHLLQMRGLKPSLPYKDTDRQRSHLLQMRGLKLRCITISTDLIMSHLLQMRGLKPGIASMHLEIDGVASFTDAWIETKHDYNRINNL